MMMTLAQASNKAMAHNGGNNQTPNQHAHDK